jgi:hypothetical protein
MIKDIPQKISRRKFLTDSSFGLINTFFCILKQKIKSNILWIQNDEIFFEFQLQNNNFT